MISPKTVDDPGDAVYGKTPDSTPKGDPSPSDLCLVDYLENDYGFKLSPELKVEVVKAMHYLFEDNDLGL